MFVRHSLSFAYTQLLVKTRMRRGLGQSHGAWSQLILKRIIEQISANSLKFIVYSYLEIYIYMYMYIFIYYLSTDLFDLFII